MGLLDKLSSWLGAGRGGVPVCVLVLGLDNSGKSALLRALREERRGQSGQSGQSDQSDQSAQTTQALQHEHFQSGGVRFVAWEASGAARLRALWERHYRRAHAVIFVVDAADHLRLVVAREELQLLVSHPDVRARRVPLLVFANKCDAPLALPAALVAAALGLQRVAEQPWHVCAGSALSGAGLADGVAWLAAQLRDLHAPHRN